MPKESIALDTGLIAIEITEYLLLLTFPILFE